MKKNVVICLNPFISHVIPTIAIAREVERQGGKVTFIGFWDMKEVIVNEGFGFLAICSHSNDEILALQRMRKYKRLGEVYKEIHSEITSLYKEAYAETVLIGISRFLIFLLPAMLLDMNIYLYSLCEGSPYISIDCPPVTSNYIPLSWKKKMFCCIEWGKRFLRKGISPSQMYSELFYPWTEIFRLCKARNITWKFGVDSIFPNFPVIILGSSHMDFDYSNDNLYAGLCIDQGNNQQNFQEISAYNEFLRDKSKPLIYCCMGTMSSRYINVNAFYSAIIELFRENSQWKLILSLGKKGAVFNVDCLPSNILIVDYVNQMEILNYSSIMITHGGHGSMKECICMEVPMLVFPCSYDQRGNAARIQYHQIGRRSTILEKTLKQKILGKGKKKIVAADLKPLVVELLSCEQYRTNICHMHEIILNDTELMRIVQHILE